VADLNAKHFLKTLKFRIMKTFQKFLNKVKNQNGTAMLIGGAVIDSLYGRKIKDWDVEVYGLNLEQIETILVDMNLSANMVGASFGIIKTEMDGIDFDLSVPRTENKVGIGHKGFEVTLDSNLTPKEAGRRRDLTFNSMYKNLHTGELVDPFNGLADLKQGILRATDENTFKEDPLRVLRIMQLLPRKGKTVAPETMELCRSMVGEFSELPKERVFEEFKKLLLKAGKPSMGLEFLRKSGWLVHFPELNNLIGCEQNPEWHPEGDVWNHTLMVLDNAASVRHNLPEELRLDFMFAAMLHDVGKPSTTLEDLTSPGHDEAGFDVAKSFMQRITNETKLTQNVCELTKLHMRAGQLHFADAKKSAWKRLHNKFRLDVLGWLSKCDSNGRTGRNMNSEHAPSELCFNFFEEFGTEKVKPIVTGKDLLEHGWKTGKELGDKLRELFEMQLEGATRKELLESL